MNKLKGLFKGKTGRLQYFLSLMIIVVYFYCMNTLYYSEGCLVLFPIMGSPWEDLFWIFINLALGGIYFCFLISLETVGYGFLWSLIVSISIILLYCIQTIRRCHDSGCSGWMSLVPIFSPFLLIFTESTDEVSME